MLQATEFSVVECARCGYGVVEPIPDPSTLARLYDDPRYYEQHMRYGFEAVDDVEIARISARDGLLHSDLRPLVGPNSHVLEVGCGGGFLLRWLSQECQARVCGLELSAAAARFCQDRLRLAVQSKPYEMADFAQPFDLLIMNHVLEHFLEPETVLAKVRRDLVPRGLFYFRVPDHGSYDRRSYAAAWPAYLPFHISYFTEGSLRILLERAGFEVLSVRRFLSDRVGRNLPPHLRGVVRRALARLQRALGGRFLSGRTLTMIARSR